MSTIEDLRIGDVILPPARELQLWMRRHAAEQGFSDSALHLTVREISEGQPDRRGRWMIVKCAQTAEWNRGQVGRAFTFKARPATLWPIIQRNP